MAYQFHICKGLRPESRQTNLRGALWFPILFMATILYGGVLVGLLMSAMDLPSLQHAAISSIIYFLILFFGFQWMGGGTA